MTTSTGFEYELVGDFINDFEFLSLIRELDNANGNESEVAMLSLDLGKKLLGKAQYNAMIQHLKSISENGTISVEAGYKELDEIIRGIIDSKKKS